MPIVAQVESSDPVSEGGSLQDADGLAPGAPQADVPASSSVEMAEQDENSELEESEQLETGASDAAESVHSPASGRLSSKLAATPNQSQEEDPRSDLEKQPYEFERCTVQIAIQLLPNDGEATGRPVLIGVRTHLDAPIVQMMRANALGDLPLAITTLLGQLKGELPAREQAARDRWEKEKEAHARRHTKAPPAKEAKTVNAAKPAKPKTVQAATAPAPSVLTDAQRAHAVGQAAVANKQQMALF